MKNIRRTLFIALSAAALVTACKKDDKKAEPKTEAPSASKVAVGTNDMGKKAEPVEEKMDAMARFKACWAAFNKQDEAAFGECYDDNSEWMMVDMTPPMSGKGRDSAEAWVKGFWAAFPDLNSAHQLVLHNGDKFASIVLTQGTNSGDFMGMPATNKKVSLFETQLVSITPAGTVGTQSVLSDQSVIAHQLGMHMSDRAPDAENAWPAPLWISAANDEAETANVELVKAMSESIHKGDYDAYLANVADDISFRYAGDKEPMVGMEAYKKGFEMWNAMADHKGEIVDIWAAGDWVVTVSDNTSTMKMDMPGAKGSKGKEVKNRSIEYMQVSEGKVKTHWVFENSMAYAIQLGMMDMPQGDAMKAKAPTKGQ